MNTAKKICLSDDQGVVHVDLPIGRPGHRVEVLVVWGEVDDSNDLMGEEASMADLVGLLQPGELERHPEGAYETRDPIA